MIEFKIIPGLMEYDKALSMMEDEVENLLQNPSIEKIFLLEHPDTYSAGTGFEAKDLKDVPQNQVHMVGRGGKITYHGPGQRIIYPILNLAGPDREKDIRKYIKDLELVSILTLADFGIDAFTIDGMIGIWVKVGGLKKKIGAIGVRVRRWVTFHGMAINISTDLTKFSKIIPCGIGDLGVTSIKELGSKVSFKEFDVALIKRFQEVFG